MSSNRIEEIINTVICGDCIEVMKTIPSNSIDLVVTSPPYDDLRDYCGYAFDVKNTAEQLYRIMKQGGVVVWVVGDATKDGDETGTSFKQALLFKEKGFNLHDTMIYEKDAPANPSSVRYHQIFEFMFVFSKGNPATFTPIKDRKNYYTKSKSSTSRLKDGQLIPKKDRTWGEMGMRNNIWRYACGFQKSTKDLVAYDHPAIFPDSLASDHIQSWSKKGDIVLDCFSGSGTTVKMAKMLGRKYIGIEKEKKYCEISEKRLEQDYLF